MQRQPITAADAATMDFSQLTGVALCAGWEVGVGSAIKLLIRFESYGTTLFGLLHQCLSHVPFITFGK